MAEVFERRGTQVCILIDWPPYREVWVNYANFMAAHKYVHVPMGGFISFDEFEDILGLKMG